MDTDGIPADLHVLDSLVRQSRLNDAVTEVLVTIHRHLQLANEDDTELRGDVALLGVEVARLNDRMARLTETVARLMGAPEPEPTELHSVKVPERMYWYPAFCRSCGHHWDSDAGEDQCPNCESDEIVVGPLTRLAGDA